MTQAIGGRIVRGAIWSAAESWGRHLFTFVIVVVLARQLDAEDFGLAALAMVAPIILAVPVTNGIPDALVQRPDLEPIHLDSAFWLLLGTGAVLTLLICAAAGPFAWLMGEPEIAPLARWASLVVVIQSIGSVPAAVLRRHLDFRLFALRTALGTAIGGTLGIALALTGHGVWSLVFMQVCKVSVESTILLTCGQWKPQAHFSLDRCRDLSGFAAPLVIQSLWNFVNDELPKVIIGFFAGAHAVGILAFARRPLEFLTQCFLGPVTSVTMPAVSRMQADSARINAFLARAAQMTALVGFPVFTGFAVVAPQAVPLVFGSQWSEAVTAVQLLMLLGLTRIVDSLLGLSLLALGHSRLLLTMNVVYTGFCLLILPVAAYFGGLEPAVAGIVLCNIMLLPVFFYYARRVGGIHAFAALASFPRLALCTALMGGAIWLLRQFGPDIEPVAASLAAEVAVGAVTYLGALALLMPAELRSAAALVRQIRG